MSSSPRPSSSRSTRTVDHLNKKFRSWRTSSFSSNQRNTTTSLSIVFAEPEHGSPLGRAADRLPLSRRTSRSSLRDYNPANVNPAASSSSSTLGIMAPAAAADLPTPPEEERTAGAQQPDGSSANQYVCVYSSHISRLLDAWDFSAHFTERRLQFRLSPRTISPKATSWTGTCPPRSLPQCDIR
jgi:hypothetical protein